MEEKFDDVKLRELKESEIPALNRSSVKYNMINLQYEDSYDGAELKYRDDVMKRNMAMAAPSVSRSATTFSEATSGAGSDRIPKSAVPTSANTTRSPNQKARLRMTPTTAAVITLSAALIDRLSRSRSI